MDYNTIKQKTTSVIKKILVIIGLVLLMIAAFFTFGNYSEGDRAGVIIKLSSRGYVFKTNEGELNLGMVYVEGSDASVNKSLWNFSVKNEEELLKKMQSAMLNADRVKLHYKEKYYRLPWMGDTKYVVTSMEIEEKKNR